MIFNSLPFAIFLPLVFIIYWSGQKLPLRIQNLFILIASYVFYGWWDYRFLILIFISSLVDFIIGQLLEGSNDQRRRKLLLSCSLATNLGLLGFFKYFNFFAGSFVNLFNAMGFQADYVSLKIILPVGISFYTFQTLSYTIDIYRRKIQATRDPIAFFAFVSFFPQLVAGPIERAMNLLPQFKKKRVFEVQKAKDGLRQLLWGFLKKVVVADNIGLEVDQVFANYQNLDGFTLMVGIFLFSVQVYCDFSGYSDIAIGTARLFGFSLMRNFSFPFFSRSIVEYWRRWHISLSTWFRDYIYFPLGGSRVGLGRRIFNIVTTFTISGLWHGASWHFVAWGFINGIYFIPSMLITKQKKYEHVVAHDRIFPTLKEFRQMLSTFSAITFSLIFLRSETLTDSINYIQGFFRPWEFGLDTKYIIDLFYCFVIIGTEWFQRKRDHGLQIGHLNLPLRWAIYIILIICFLIFGAFEKREFYYFQF